MPWTTAVFIARNKGGPVCKRGSISSEVPQCSMHYSPKPWHKVKRKVFCTWKCIQNCARFSVKILMGRIRLYNLHHYVPLHSRVRKKWLPKSDHRSDKLRTKLENHDMNDCVVPNQVIQVVSLCLQLNISVELAVNYAYMLVQRRLKMSFCCIIAFREASVSWITFLALTAVILSQNQILNFLISGDVDMEKSEKTSHTAISSQVNSSMRILTKLPVQVLTLHAPIRRREPHCDQPLQCENPSAPAEWRSPRPHTSRPDDPVYPAEQKSHSPQTLKTA